MRKLFGSEQIWLGLLGIIGFLVLWELLCCLNLVSAFVVAPPTKVFPNLVLQFIERDLITDIKVTLGEWVMGFSSAAILGIPLGVLMGWYPAIGRALYPYVWVLYVTPLIALYNLFIIAFGMGRPTITFISFLFAFVPFVNNAVSGVTNTGPSLVNAGRSFCGNDRDILWKIVMPSSVPFLVAGLRIGIGRAFLGVVIGELFMGNSGLGFRLAYYGAKMQALEYYPPLIMLVTLAVLVSQFLRWVEDKANVWRT